ncbi:MAG: hypothetical protein ACYS6K_14070 [Planctomycetota bacterium]|jgi:hypothetical protein
MSAEEKPKIAEEPQKTVYEEPQEEVCKEQQRRGQYIANMDNTKPPRRGQYVAGEDNTELSEGKESIDSKPTTIQKYQNVLTSPDI